MDVVGTCMVKRDRDSFDWYFPLYLQRTMPLLDHLYVRIDKSGGDVESFLEPYGDRIHWDWQFPHRSDNHLEDKERQALLDWALSTDAEWCFCFDSDEVLEEGAAEALRGFVDQDPSYRILMFILNYSSHHRQGYLLDRDEPDGGQGVRVGRGFRLSLPSIRNFRYQGDLDGLHCGTLPLQHKRPAILKEIFVTHYHACTPQEWLQKRAFYEGTEEVRKHGGIDHLYPLCGEFPYSCDRFGKEANARPYGEIVTDGPERWERLQRRIDKARVPA